MSEKNPIKIISFVCIFITVIVLCCVGIKYIPDLDVFDTDSTETLAAEEGSISDEDIISDESDDSEDNTTKNKPTKNNTTKSAQKKTTTAKAETKTTTESEKKTTGRVTTTRLRQTTTRLKTTTKPKTSNLSYISVYNYPTKTTYYVGDKFSASGLKVYAYYTDTTSKDVTSSVKYATPDMSYSGTQNVKVEYTDSFGKKVTTSFNIYVYTPSVSITSTSLSLEKGDTYYLYAITTPLGCTVTWHTNNSNVAKVDKSGMVKAVGAGETEVYGSTTYNGITYTSSYCDVVVTDPNQTTTQVQSRIDIEDVYISSVAYDEVAEGEPISARVRFGGYVESTLPLDYVNVSVYGPTYDDGERYYGTQLCSFGNQHINSTSLDLSDDYFYFDMIRGATYEFTIYAVDVNGNYQEYSFTQTID